MEAFGADTLTIIITKSWSLSYVPVTVAFFTERQYYAIVFLEGSKKNRER